MERIVTAIEIPLLVATPHSTVHHANRNAMRPLFASTESVGGASCSAVPAGGHHPTRPCRIKRLNKIIGVNNDCDRNLLPVATIN